MLIIADIVLFSIHMIVLLGNVLGWIWPKTRQAHRVLILLTLASWFILGIWKGWGYFVLTDWEWDIKRMLGEKGLPHSFTAYLANNILGLGIGRKDIDLITVLGLIVGILGAIGVYYWERRMRRIA